MGWPTFLVLEAEAVDAFDGPCLVGRPVKPEDITDDLVRIGARAFAAGFSGDHPCQSDPCFECEEDARRVLVAVLCNQEENADGRA